MADIAEIRMDYQKLGQCFHLQTDFIRSVYYQHDRDLWKALNEIVSEWLRWNFDDTTEDDKYPTRRWLIKAN